MQRADDHRDDDAGRRPERLRARRVDAGVIGHRPAARLVEHDAGHSRRAASTSGLVGRLAAVRDRLERPRQVVERVGAEHAAHFAGRHRRPVPDRASIPRRNRPARNRRRTASSRSPARSAASAARSSASGSSTFVGRCRCARFARRRPLRRRAGRSRTTQRRPRARRARSPSSPRGPTARVTNARPIDSKRPCTGRRATSAALRNGRGVGDERYCRPSRMFRAVAARFVGIDRCRARPLSDHARPRRCAASAAARRTPRRGCAGRSRGRRPRPRRTAS